ncbi:Citrate synthase 4, mitochondrial [Chlamydiales bacterium STE3]|nr:Citrate synthase 4, mitochondrial [Chlamydiales bacterium STE3]
MSELIFEITKDNLETGMRGYPVGYCTTSTVDPTKGLFYSGKSVKDLAFEEPEKVIYLLYFGKEGSKEELEQFKSDLQKRAHCSEEMLQHLCSLPRIGHPMKLFTTALLIAGMYESCGNYREDCLNLIAKIPQITATVINYHAGWGKGNSSRPELGYMENFTQMLAVPHVNQQELNQVFQLFNILHYDHGGGNLSTFVGKAIASGLEDMYGSIAGAMCALAGPRHGKANQECLEFNQKILAQVGEDASLQDVEKLLRSFLDSNQLIFGFGHAVLRVEDPRATVLFEVAEKKYHDHPLVKIASLLRRAGPEVLKENPKISDPYPNVDSISGTLLSAAGFDYPEYFTLLFGMSRVVGIAIQIVYERVVAREGKGTPIIRPKYIFKPGNS